MSISGDSDHSTSERVIILAPTARDAQVTCRLLADAGVDCAVGEGEQHVEALIRDGAGALMLTDLTLATPAFAGVRRALEMQPAWSDLPVLALCRQGLLAPALRDAHLRNLTVLDRPTSTRALVSAVMTALRGRRWQYQIRDQIESLQQAERSLRVADQRKDEFLATLAHELRNPLAPIRNGLELLSRQSADGPQRKRVTDMMDRQMSQLLRLIDDLLEVSRISTGKLILQRERLDMRRVVETALEACQPLIARSGHRLTVTLPEEEVCVDGDLTRLAQSLSNVVNNAAKYTPDGGRIDVALSRDGDDAVLTVQDSGVGLAPDMTDRVFDMFAQVSHSLERAQGGLGIGLALVKSLVSLHGGQVTAASPGPGLGSTFTIRLPLLQETSTPQPFTDEVTAASQALRVLVVDDNEDAANALAMLLEMNGHSVQVEHSGPAALRAAARFLPQAVFCDIGMPSMDGYEVALQLRADARFADTLLVALTGWGSTEDKQRSREAGFDRHLTKPAGEEVVSALLADI